MMTEKTGFVFMGAGKKKQASIFKPGSNLGGCGSHVPLQMNALE